MLRGGRRTATFLLSNGAVLPLAIFLCDWGAASGGWGLASQGGYHGMMPALPVTRVMVVTPGYSLLLPVRLVQGKEERSTSHWEVCMLGISLLRQPRWRASTILGSRCRLAFSLAMCCCINKGEILRASPASMWRQCELPLVLGYQAPFRLAQVAICRDATGQHPPSTQALRGQCACGMSP